MNYTRIYDALVSRARDRIVEGYTETHHVVPRCMGGTDEPTNLVELTPEEHFLAHQLLVKMYPTEWKLVLATRMMAMQSQDHPEGVRSKNKIFGWLRRRDAELKRAPLSQEHKDKIADALKGRFFSEELRSKLSAAQTGKKRSEEHKQKIRDARKRQIFSSETRKKMSDSAKNRKNKTRM